MTYELWDTVGRNLVGAFESEQAALDLVRTAIDRHGHAYAATFTLVCEDERGQTRTLASGDALVERANAVAA